MFVVIAKSSKYPQLFVVRPNIMSQWGDPLVFTTKEDARAEAVGWAGLFGGDDRKVVVRAAAEQPSVPFPPGPRTNRIILRPKRRAIIKRIL